MFEATRQLIALAIAQRDALRDALGDDRANEDLRRQVETWQAAGGAYPSGRTGRLLDQWQRNGEFGRLLQQANAETIEAGLGAVLLPKLERVRDAHGLLLDEYRRRSEGEPAADRDAKERHAAALSELIEIVNETPAGGLADKGLDEKPVSPAEPKVYLTSWREILDALRLKSDRKDKVAKLNKDFDGPIVVEKQGAQPRVERSTLLAWYNGLEARFQELRQRQRDKQATAADQYGYGSEGTVVPEIGGSVKRRRRDAKR